MPDNDPKAVVKTWSDDVTKVRDTLEELAKRLTDLPVEGEMRARMNQSLHHAHLVLGVVGQELADRGKKE